MYNIEKLINIGYKLVIDIERYGNNFILYLNSNKENHDGSYSNVLEEFVDVITSPGDIDALDAKELLFEIKNADLFPIVFSDNIQVGMLKLEEKAEKYLKLNKEDKTKLYVDLTYNLYNNK